MFRKDYLKGTLQILGTIIIGGFSYLFLSLILLFYPYDFFADNLSIPENVKFEKPISLNQNVEVKSKKFDNANFILYDDMQPGIYKYDLYLNKIEKGKVFGIVLEWHAFHEDSTALNCKMLPFYFTN